MQTTLEKDPISPYGLPQEILALWNDLELLKKVQSALSEFPIKKLS